MTAEPIDVLVVGDDRRTDLADAIHGGGDLRVVQSVANGQAAVREADHAAVVVVAAPDGIGRGAMTTLRRLSERSRVLLVTAATRHATLVRAIRAGVAGFVVTTAPDPGELRDAVRAVHRGLSYVSAAAAPLLFDVVRGETPPPPADDGETLTGREAEVVGMIARGLDNATIAGRLGISQKTVKNHINRAYTKLGVDSRRAAIAAWHALPVAG